MRQPPVKRRLSSDGAALTPLSAGPAPLVPEGVRLGEINVPALVIVGRRDLITRAEAGEYIAGALPGATLERVADAGHMGPVEKHAAHVAAITTFVERVTQPHVKTPV